MNKIKNMLELSRLIKRKEGLRKLEAIEKSKGLWSNWFSDWSSEEYFENNDSLNVQVIKKDETVIYRPDFKDVILPVFPSSEKELTKEETEALDLDLSIVAPDLYPKK